MKFSFKSIQPYLVATAVSLLAISCQEDTGGQDERDQEQRFFDVYVAANYPGMKPQPNGIYYIENREGTGQVPDSDDWLLVNHVCYTIPEDIIYETYIENVAIDNHFWDSLAMYGPYKLLNGSRNQGLTSGINMMKEGGQATMFFTSDLGYGANGSGKVSAYKSLKYEIELIEVIKDMDAYEQAKIDAYLDTVPQYDTIHNPEIDAFMYYIMDRPTDGNPVAMDSLISVAYKGYLIDGRVFDEKTADNPIEFTLGSAEFIPGWNMGLLRLKEGEKARFIIPYQLAYGEEGKVNRNTGNRAIPPYETLVFDIEIISVETAPGSPKQ